MKVILIFSMYKSKNYFCEKYGNVWYESFKKLSMQYYKEIIPNIPKIGKSIFSMNYKFAPAYIAWYKAFQELKMNSQEIDKEIWKLNEFFMNTFPKSILKLSGRMYLESFRKKAMKHMERQKKNRLHPYDWKIDFRNIDNNTFEIDIKECAYKKLAAQFQVENMLPGVCRMDYLMANLMENGFVRTKTLGDGDDCCDCRYSKVGHCEWAPEKGFIDRK